MEPAVKRARTLADVPMEVQRTVHAFVGGAHGATPRRLFLQQVRSSAYNFSWRRWLQRERVKWFASAGEHCPGPWLFFIKKWHCFF